VNDSVRARIAKRAYELYREHGEEHGRDLDNWLAAEKEVLAFPRPADNNGHGKRPAPERGTTTTMRTRKKGGARR